MQIETLAALLGEFKVVGFEDQAVDPVVKSAGRVFQILELFDVLRRDAHVSEISELLDLPQSSTSVLLRSMVSIGYLSYNRDTRAFRPTTKVAVLGSWINGPLLSDGALMRLVDRINEASGQSVVIAVRNRIWAQYIHVAQARAEDRIFLVKGANRPLTRGAAGLALLSDLPDAEVKRIALRINAEIPGRDSIAEVMERVEAVRMLGYAFNCDRITPGGGMIALRVPNVMGAEELVIGIAGFSADLRARKDELVDVARCEIAAYRAEIATMRLNDEVPVGGGLTH